MSWRFLAATGFVVVILGCSRIAVAQDDASASKVKTDSNAAATADAAPEATKTTASKAPSAKSKASTGKAKTRKSSKSASSTSDSSTANSSSAPHEPKYEVATFGGGCFWHVEADFERLNGVVSAVSGYAGGQVRNPNYEMVHEGVTGHAEVVMVQYDPDIISYEDLLKEFFTKIHDPTTLNRQGPDYGTQYRSIILYHNEAQRKAALEVYQKVVDARVWRNPIVTQLVALKNFPFYRAEDEHQDYYGGKPTASRRRSELQPSPRSSSPRGPRRRRRNSRQMRRQLR